MGYLEIIQKLKSIGRAFKALILKKLPHNELGGEERKTLFIKTDLIPSQISYMIYFPKIHCLSDEMGEIIQARNKLTTLLLSNSYLNYRNGNGQFPISTRKTLYGYETPPDKEVL